MTGHEAHHRRLARWDNTVRRAARRTRRPSIAAIATLSLAAFVAACSSGSGDSGGPETTQDGGATNRVRTESATTSSGDELNGAGDLSPEGRLGTLVHAKSGFDEWTLPLDDASWSTMRALYDEMIVYSPYFDKRLGLFDNTFVYRDLYGLKVASDRDQRAYDHPDWVLRTTDDEAVYIPWGCGEPDGCPQFAADVGNPEYRAHFIEDVGRLVDLGYAGLLIDDVNTVWRLSDRAGVMATPVDPRTGTDLVLDDWRRYVAEFVEAIRDEYPDLPIMHNSIWFADSPTFDDPSIDRQIAAADIIMLERGATDSGIVDGDAKFGFESMLNFVDRAHDLGTNVLFLDESATTEDEQWFNVAAGLLVNDGHDRVSTEDYTYLAPPDVWRGFEIDLGGALGPRHVETGVWRRDFADGIVVLNEPNRDPVVVELGGEFVASGGAVVDEVLLEPGRAVVLTRPAP